VCRARWRGENRTIFNTPNPRLMNVSLLDSKLLHGGNLERRASRGSVRGAPSRHASMTSLRPANSPTGNSIVMTSSASARVHASGNAANHPPNTTTTTTVTSTQWPPKLRGDPLAGEDHNARLYFLYISLFAKKLYIFPNNLQLTLEPNNLSENQVFFWWILPQIEILDQVRFFFCSTTNANKHQWKNTYPRHFFISPKQHFYKFLQAQFLKYCKMTKI
jgi:hypothetical protein